jgi:hypothetical protein
MRIRNQTETAEIAKRADDAWSTLHESIRSIINDAKHERRRRRRAGIDTQPADYVIETLGGMRDAVQAMCLPDGAWRGPGIEQIARHLADGWAQ